MSQHGTFKMQIKKKSLGDLFVVKMKGSGGESMYHKTFGNMILPSNS